MRLELESWRHDLLRIVLRVAVGFGALVYLPSVYLAIKTGLTGIAMLDTVALLGGWLLAVCDKLPHRLRAGLVCAIFYALGCGLMVYVGPISQIYLLGFSLLASLLLSPRWGLASVLLNAATLMVLGLRGLASSQMTLGASALDWTGWTVVTFNFVLVNGSLVGAVGFVTGTLESALGRALQDRASLEQSKALLAIAGRTARLGGWSADLRKGRITCSDEICELHQVAPGTIATVHEALNFYSPESRYQVGRAFQRCARDGEPYDLEASILTAQGQALWVRVIGTAVRDHRGNIYKLQGSVQDITPEKLASRSTPIWKSSFARPKKWRPSAIWPAASPTTSTTCSR
jgi:PAS domain-containing protein